MRYFIGHFLWWLAYQIDPKFTPTHLNPMEDEGAYDPQEKEI